MADKLWPNNVQPRDGKPLGKIQQWEGNSRGRPFTQAEVTKSPKYLFSTAGKSHLVFDGKNLHWVGEPHGHKTYKGVSGADGYQSPEFQATVNKGPIPEGIWKVGQDQLQHIKDTNLANRFGGTFLSPISTTFGGDKVGQWPGDEIAWGRHRIWLHPKEGTDTLNRDKFSIHGGCHEGSAGCIDLTEHMNEFSKDFQTYGKDMDLWVTYGNKADKDKN